jgi:3-deoxy-D-manno-octulosonic-acid transferase
VVLYRLLSILALLAYAPYALLRSLAGRRRLGDLRGRLGWTPAPDLSGGIWVHAVSVGEVGVARDLLRTLARLEPGLRLGLSATTAAGRDLAQRIAADTASVFAFPFDLSGPVERALASTRPGLVLLTETEIWPLFLERAGRRGIPVALVNGRVSARSFARYRLAGSFIRRTLSRIAFFAMQSEPDAERIRALGAPPERVRITGNIKYDLPPASPFADAGELQALAGGRPILVAASTGEGEEEIVLRAWRPFAARSLLVLAPRRPERFESVAELIQREGFEVVRRSRHTPAGSAPVTRSPDPMITRCPVYLLDSIGELTSVYGLGAFAFVGGSLIPAGGHNPIEAWAQGLTVATGLHMENFREIARRGEEEGFLSRLGGVSDLQAWIASCLDQPEAARSRGIGARAFVGRNRGAAQATAELVLPLLRDGAAHRAAR